MMKSFIAVKYDNYSFVAPLHIKLLGLDITVKCKIDTGCMYTCVPIRSLLTGTLSKREKYALQLKQVAIDNHLPFERSYGVSDNFAVRERDKILIRQGNLIDCKSLKFKHEVELFEIANCILDIKTVGVNYDRMNNILIGMDILSKLDIHIGKDRNSGNTLLLVCPLNNINKDYLDEIHSSFGYIR